jgi:UDP-N-acetylmuramoyl-tripeptide--D-alanyl-D-alanine ligase
MLELGEQGPDLHRQIGLELAGQGDAIHAAVLIGKLSMFTAETLSRQWPPERIHGFAQWSDDLPARVAGLLRPGDVVLIKASRGMRLERLLNGWAIADRRLPT